jgi:predicted permease
MVVFSKVVSIFILVVVGYVARKAKAMDRTLISGLSGFILNVAIPFTVLASFDRSIPRSAMPDLFVVALWALAIHALSIIVARFAYAKTEDGDRKVLSYVTVFSNCGFMGFPVAESVFGKIGVMYGSIYVIVFQTFVWTYGVALFSGIKGGGAQIRKALFNPGNAAVLIGLGIWLLPFDLPSSITSSISTLSTLTTPLSMLVVGATLAEVPVKGLLKGKELWIGTFARLALIPLVFYGIMRLTGFTSLPGRLAIFLASMPAAAQTVIFAERYKADVGLASRMVFVSTVLSALTIPVFAILLR